MCVVCVREREKVCGVCVCGVCVCVCVVLCERERCVLNNFKSRPFVLFPSTISKHP